MICGRTRSPRPSCRRARSILATAFFAAVGTSCGSDPSGPGSGSTGEARLTAQPRAPSGSISTGQSSLGLAGGRDGIVYVPEGYQPGVPAPMAVVLHEGGGSVADVASLFDLADELGVVLLAPESRAATWDLVGAGEFGADVSFIDRALEHAFARVNVDPLRILLAGFGDGASYALSLGLNNGDLFSHVAAWSPGFVVAENPVGRPLIYVSHGTADGIFDFFGTQDSIVPLLLRSGYNVQFQPFGGGHYVPPEISRDTFLWFTGQGG